VRFAEALSDEANRAAIALGRALAADPPEGVEEVAPGLVSVFLRLSEGANFARIRGEIMLRGEDHEAAFEPGREHRIPATFDGEDLPAVAARLGLGRDAFVARHNRAPLRVLATGFAPGFVYCGFHDGDLAIPRRAAVRPMVPAGTVLFAAGQTAIAATPIRTGWHVIGRTTYRNFEPAADPPTRLRAGDSARFEDAR
jgi:KipI family sensor histidine kinase inhibitor